MKKWDLPLVPSTNGSKVKTFWIQSSILCDHRNKASLGWVADKNKRLYIASLDFASLICTILYFLMVTGFIQKRRETGFKTLWQPGESKVPIPAKWEVSFGYINSKKMIETNSQHPFISFPSIFTQCQPSSSYMGSCQMVGMCR